MTLSEFISKYTGKFVEAGGSANAINQCVDLVNTYLKEVLNQPIILGTNAVDFPSKLSDKYNFFPNSPTGFPNPGDIIVFKQYGTRYLTPGHIAVVVLGDVNNVTMFEENYPTGSVCTTHTRNYLGCVGWFRLKETEVSNEQILKDKISDLETKMATLNEAVASKSLEVNHIRTELENEERDSSDLLSQLMEARKQRDQFKFERDDFEIKATNLQKAIDVANETTNGNKVAIQGLQIEITALTQTIKELKLVKLSEVNLGLIYQELFYRLFRKK